METTFNDADGIEWALCISPYEYSKIKTELKFDSYDLVLRGADESPREAADRARAAIMKLETDDAFLAELLWLTCEEDARRLGTSRVDFIRGLRGDCLNDALSAWLRALRDFFREPVYRSYLDSMIEYMKKAKGLATTMAMAELKKVDVDQMVSTFSDNATSLLASLDSIQNTKAGKGGNTVTPNC